MCKFLQLLSQIRSRKGIFNKGKSSKLIRQPLQKRKKQLESSDGLDPERLCSVEEVHLQETPTTGKKIRDRTADGSKRGGLVEEEGFRSEKGSFGKIQYQEEPDEKQGIRERSFMGNFENNQDVNRDWLFEPSRRDNTEVKTNRDSVISVAY